MYHATLKAAEIDQIAGMLNSQNWAATTYNRRLTMLQKFFSWLVDNGRLDKSPLKDVCGKRNKKKVKNPKRLPLTDQEVGLFLEAIKNNTFCPSYAFYKHSHYYPFLLFVFCTGVRNESCWADLRICPECFRFWSFSFQYNFLHLLSLSHPEMAQVLPITFCYSHKPFQ